MNLPTSLSKLGHRVVQTAQRLLLVAACAFSGGAMAITTPLSDGPIRSTNAIPANVMLALSVEWPTGVVEAYNDEVTADCPGRDANNDSYCYTAAKTYIGYFDPYKCYSVVGNVFTPSAYTNGASFAAPKAGDHSCSMKWSGNFLNWATMQTTDEFRWAMTGGDRVVDTATTTVLEKARHDGQGGFSQFPIKRVGGAPVGAFTPVAPSTVTPFNDAELFIRISNLNTVMWVSANRSVIVDNNHPDAGNSGNTLALPATANYTEPGLCTAYTGSGTCAQVTVSTGGTRTIVENQTSTEAGQCPATGGTILSCTNASAPVTTNLRRVARFDSNDCGSVASGYVSCIPTRRYTVTELGACDPAPAANLILGSCSTRSGGRRRYDRTEAGTCSPAPVPVSPTTYTGCNAAGSIVVRDETGACPVAGAISCSIVSSTSAGTRTVVRQITTVQAGQCAAYTGSGTCTNTTLAAGVNSRRITNGTVGGASPYPTITPLYVRVKVCDEVNYPETQTRCTDYVNGGSVSYKPEGLVQENSLKLRFGAFGYLLDNSQQRDGGVLRARMKDVGPLKASPGTTPVTNGAREWLATDGTYVFNPDAADATTTGFSADNSGVIQYLNKFGRRAGYKSYDPVAEMYAEVLKYFKGPQSNGATPSYSSGLDATMVDGFPVIRNWNDPIQYSCQKNFVITIADANTWLDKNLPGNTDNNGEPPAAGLDTGYNVVDLTNTVGAFETTTTAALSNWGAYRNGRDSAQYLSGLAYYAHTTDLRPGNTYPGFTNKNGKQTITSYFVDVREANGWGTGNDDPRVQMWMAAKYGGFKYSQAEDVSDAPVVFDNTKPWANAAAGMVQGFPVPKNYFAANQPDKLVSGLRSAFADIGAQIGSAAGGSVASTDVSILGGGNAFYKVQYKPGEWSGNVQAITFAAIDANGVLDTVVGWDANRVIDAQVGTNSGSRVVITAVPGVGTLGQPFRLGNLSAAQKTALGPATPASEQQDVLDYLRGDRTKENLLPDGVLNPSGKYRTRKFLLGDIVDSEAIFIGAPDAEYDDALNPGYDAFKTTYAARKPLLYVGANDGMLHALDANPVEASGGGREIFAFIPSAMYQGPNNTPALSGLRSLTNDPLDHRFFVNGKPVVKDVDFDRLSGAPTGTGTPDWRSILIGGFGKGGKGFYALDVTNPAQLTTEASAATKVLWEFSDEDMGYSYGLPVITKTRKYGWVVLLTSGYNNTTSSVVANRGKGFLYVLNPRTGALLKKITLPEGTVTDPSGFAQIAAYVPSAASGMVDEVYGGDLLGNVWRIDFKGDATVEPSAIKFAELKDTASPAKGQPITTAPVVDYSPNDKKRYVFVGTGQYLDASDATRTQVQSFYTLRDGTQGARYEDSPTPTLGISLPAGVTFPLNRAQLANNANLLTGLTTSQIQAKPSGWYYDLPGVTLTGNIRERISVQPKAEALGVIAWVGTLPETDVCNPNGRSFTYKASFGSGITQLYTKDAAGLITKQTSIETTELVKIQTVNINGETATLGSSATGDPFKVGPSSYTVGSGRYLNWRELLQ